MRSPHCKPFYSLLNLSLLQDVPELMAPAAGYARALNDSLLVSTRTSPDRQRFPPHNCTWRGGGFGIAGHASLSPDALLAFFTEGKKYRQPAFLATSFAERVAHKFIDYALDSATCTVLWVVHFDPKGRNRDANGVKNKEFDDGVRVKHVNYISNSHIMDAHGHGEAEYLFAPYSVFTVRKVTNNTSSFSNVNGDLVPCHTIELDPAPDNAKEPMDLPLAPWC